MQNELMTAWEAANARMDEQLTEAQELATLAEIDALEAQLAALGIDPLAD